MITVSIFINGNPILTRSAVNISGKDVCKYRTDCGHIIKHNRNDGAIPLAKKMLDLIDVRIQRGEKKMKANDNIKKVIRDGKVAVLLSPGYGAGWYTWNVPLQAVFHPKLVELVENDKREEITEKLMIELFGKEGDCYIGGKDNLIIEWVYEGQIFTLEEYDGYESIRFIDGDYIKA